MSITGNVEHIDIDDSATQHTWHTKWHTNPAKQTKKPVKSRAYLVALADRVINAESAIRRIRVESMDDIAKGFERSEVNVSDDTCRRSSTGKEVPDNPHATPRQ